MLPASQTLGAPEEKTDTAKYKMGLKIYIGAIRLPRKVISEEVERKQKLELRKLQILLEKQVDKKTAEKFLIEKYAGKLTKEQFEAMDYYLVKRYKLKKKGKFDL